MAAFAEMGADVECDGRGSLTPGMGVNESNQTGVGNPG